MHVLSACTDSVVRHCFSRYLLGDRVGLLPGKIAEAIILRLVVASSGRRALERLVQFREDTLVVEAVATAKLRHVHVALGPHNAQRFSPSSRTLSSTKPLQGCCSRILRR